MLISQGKSWWESLQETVSYFKVRYTDGLVGTDAVTGRRFILFMAMTMGLYAQKYKVGTTTALWKNWR